MRSHRIVALLGWAACVSCASAPSNPSQAEVGSVPERMDDLGPLKERFPVLEEYLQERFTQAQLPGLAVGVVTRDGLAWSHGFGVRSLATRAPVDADTLFRMASVTKVFTSLAVLQLRDEGKLDLDVPAERYLPEMAKLRYPTTDSPRITLRHLMTHTSGLSRLGRMDDFASYTTDMKESDLVGSLNGLPLERVPGTVEIYSNLGVALIGVIIGRVSGMPYQTYVKTHIFDPLKMDSSTFEFDNAPERRALGYHLGEASDFESGPNWKPSRLPWRLGASDAMGGLSSSVNDMARFMTFELNAWPPRDGPETGPALRATVRESHRTAGPVRPGKLTTGANWFLVRSVGRGVIVWHNGITDGFRAMVWLCPRAGIGLVAMTNLGTDRLNKIAMGAIPILVAPISGASKGPAHPSAVPMESTVTDPTSGEELPLGDDPETPAARP